MCIHTMNIKELLPKAIDVSLSSDLSIKQASVIWLHNAIFKKFHDDKMTKAAKLAAVRGFIESNYLCKTWRPDRESYYYDLLVRAKTRMWEILHSGRDQACVLNMFDIVQRALPGPGSSLGTKETSFIGKLFHSKLSTYDSSGSLYRYFSENLSCRWRNAEKMRYAEYGLDFRDSSMMSFAHKSQETARTINTEASLEMLLQKGAASIIEDLLIKFYNIDIKKQPKINRMLARLGSLDGSIATIDLKDGSNRKPYELVKFVMPTQAFMTLDRIRATCMSIPKELVDDCGRSVVKNYMFSTQGNGFTFALQTLLFAVLTEVSYQDMGLPVNCHDYPHFSVFGDDIVVCKHAYYKVTKLLEFCGLTVNLDKSFNSGSFRESCGADFFKGHNIRGVYIKRFRHERHKYSAFNRLCEWSIRNGVDVTDVLLYLKRLVSFRPVPFDEHDECGIKVPSEFASLKSTSDGRIQYEGYQPRSRFVDVTKRFQRINHDGLLVSAIGGYLTTRKISKGVVCQGFVERQNVTRYALKRKSTSSWDFIPRLGLTTLDYQIALFGVI